MSPFTSLRYAPINDSSLSVCGKWGRWQRSVRIPPAVRRWGDLPVTRIGRLAFARDPWLEEMVIPEGVTSIGAEAFLGCTKLRSVCLPSTLERLEERAFMHCSALTDIRLPQGLSVIQRDVFTGCRHLESEADQQGGVLTVDGWVLGCAEGRDIYELDRGIRGIAAGAFDSGKRTERIPNPRYAEEMARYEEEDLYRQYWYEVPGSAPPQGDLVLPLAYTERICPVRIQYGGTLAEWSRLRIRKGEEAYPFIITAADGTAEVTM